MKKRKIDKINYSIKHYAFNVGLPYNRCDK